VNTPEHSENAVDVDRSRLPEFVAPAPGLKPTSGAPPASAIVCQAMLT
jgi:hypothetical protein